MNIVLQFFADPWQAVGTAIVRIPRKRVTYEIITNTSVVSEEEDIHKMWQFVLKISRAINTAKFR